MTRKKSKLSKKTSFPGDSIADFVTQDDKEIISYDGKPGQEPLDSMTEHLETEESDPNFDRVLTEVATSLGGENLDDLPEVSDNEGNSVEGIEMPGTVVIDDLDVQINTGDDEPIEFVDDIHEAPTKEYQGIDQDVETDADSGELEQIAQEFYKGGDSINPKIPKNPKELEETWEEAKRDGIVNQNKVGYYVGRILMYAVGLTATSVLATAIFAPDKIIELKQKYSSDKPTAVVSTEDIQTGKGTVESFLDRQYGPKGKDRLERPLEDILDGVIATPAFDEPRPDPYDIDPNPKNPLTNFVGTLNSAPQGSSLTQIAAAILGEGQNGINYLDLSQAEQTRLLNEVYVSNVASQYTPEQVKKILSLAMVLQDQNPNAVRNPINTEKLSGYSDLIKLARNPNNAILLRGVPLNLTTSLEGIDDGPIFTGTQVVEHYPPQEEPKDVTDYLEPVQPEVTDSLGIVLEEPYQQRTTKPKIQQPVEELELDTDEIPDVTRDLESLGETVEVVEQALPDVTEDLVDTGLTVVQDDGIVDTGLDAVLNPSSGTRAGAVRDSMDESTMPREEVAIYTQNFLDVYRLSQSSIADWKGDTTSLAMQAAQTYRQNPDAFDQPKEKRLLRTMQEFYDFDESDRLEAAVGHYLTQQERNEWFENQNLDLNLKEIATIYSVQPSKLKKSIKNVERVEEHSLRYQVGEDISSILVSTNNSRQQLYFDLRLAGISAVAERTVSMYEGFQQALEKNPELTKIAYAREHADSYGVTPETLAGKMTDTAYVVAQEATQASGKTSSQTSAKKSA